ncbi:MAG TPA: hypothetical protein VK659_16460 [Asanoa sp.]|nr:hypothetical protein [Asanoa sp.]
MTGTEPTRTLPILDVFFDSPNAAATALRDASRDQLAGTLGRLPDSAREAVLGRIGKAAAGLLELDVTDVFSAAWSRSAALRRAARETAAAPDTEQIVGLTTLNTSFAHEPSVEVRVKGVPVATVVLRVVLEVEVSGLRAVVQRGCITAVQAGTCTITGTLHVAGNEVTRRQVNVDLPLVMRLKRGIALAEASPATAP